MTRGSWAPILEAGSPVQMGGYAYRDPTGLQLRCWHKRCNDPVTDDVSCGNHTGPAGDKHSGDPGETGGGGGHGPGFQQTGGCPLPRPRARSDVWVRPGAPVGTFGCAGE